jgi:hypothetical protein
MASSFSDLLKIELIGDGEQAGSWGTTTNNNFSQSVEHAIAGVFTINTGGSSTKLLSTGNGPQAQTDNEARQACLIFTGGGSTDCIVTVPATQKIYNVHNTNASSTVTLRLSGTTTDHVLAPNSSSIVATTGAAWHDFISSALTFSAGGTISNTSGDITIDAVGDIILDADGADILFKDDGTTIGEFTNSSSDFVIKSSVSDKDLLIKGNDNGSPITALTFDMSDAGTATFNHDVVLGDNSKILLGDNTDLEIYHDATDSYIKNDTGDLIVDAANDIILDADGDEVIFKDGSTNIGHVSMDSDNLTIKSLVSDKDIIFQGNDAGTGFVALTLDMSEEGAATFNNDVTAFSDERLKTDIKTIDNALNKVCDMRGVYFNRNGAAGTGVIAQEIQDILPEVVHDKQEYLSVAYGNMVGVLIEAIKELKKEVETLKESK